MNKARFWLAALARLSADDLRLVGQLVKGLAAAERGPADTARAMLNAQPEPTDADDARARLRAVTQYLRTH